jgi:MerR family transcriptional regulator, light-induced transcriptional regulator
MNHEPLDTVPRHPIAVAARRTGLSTHVIRVWERRYGAVVPTRSDGGVRLYSDADVRRLRLLHRATEAGRPIGQVARLADGVLLGLVHEDGEEPGASGPVEAPPRRSAARIVEACVDALERLDGAALYISLSRAVVALTPVGFVREVAVPLLTRVGDLWEAGRITPAHEHLVSTHVRGALGRIIDALDAEPGAQVLVATTPSAERHEFGAMLAGIVAAEQGWRVIYLGPDLPADDVGTAAVHTGAAAVALSMVGAMDGVAVAEYLEALREALPSGVPVLVGGRAAAEHDAAIRGAGALPMPGLDTLAATLATLAAGAPETRRTK